MPRAVILVLDSVGCGSAPDAAAYGDEGADTVGHIAQACAGGAGDLAGLRTGPLQVPHLCAMGLGSACEIATGRLPAGLTRAGAAASFGIAVERSVGKDTPSGHWELAGTPVVTSFATFPRTKPCFPPAFTAALVENGRVPGLLGLRHDSGTAIIAALGEEHRRTGKPIVYTSVDSVVQIAAHEESFGLDRLLALCRTARQLCDPMRIGRVIARPFTGTTAGTFTRTANRRDFAMPPPAGTLFDRASEVGRAVASIGKTADIFAHVNTGAVSKGRCNGENLDLLMAVLPTLPDGGVAFVNLVDFDSEFGHRRDVAGYAACLEAFDVRLPELQAALRPSDLLVLTADHGNDPTAPGTDHTREVVPVLAACGSRTPMRIGVRDSLADVGASVAAHLSLSPPLSGRSWLG